MIQLNDRHKKIIEGEICPYCGQPSVRIRADEFYNYRGDGELMVCKKCNAWVGCYKSGDNKGKPMGRLANRSLRKAKIAARAEFDRLWNTKEERSEMYAKLSDYLELPPEYTHIGMFSEATCLKVIDFCYKQGIKGMNFVVRDNICPRWGSTKAGSNSCLMCPSFLCEGKEFIVCDENMNYGKLKNNETIGV